MTKYTLTQIWNTIITIVAKENLNTKGANNFTTPLLPLKKWTGNGKLSDTLIHNICIGAEFAYTFLKRPGNAPYKNKRGFLFLYPLLPQKKIVERLLVPEDNKKHIVFYIETFTFLADFHKHNEIKIKDINPLKYALPLSIPPLSKPKITQKKKHNPTPPTISQLIQKKYEILKLSEKHTDFLGYVALPFALMVAGLPGAGKSTYTLLLAKEIAKRNPKSNVLYISDEEKINPSMIDKLKRYHLKEVEKNFTIIPEAPLIKKRESGHTIDLEKIKNYDFLIIDSVQSLGLSVPAFAQLLKNARAKKISIIATFQATKEGRYKGGSQYEHDVDISLQADNGQITTRKNRFGAAGSFHVFPDKHTEPQNGELKATK